MAALIYSMCALTALLCAVLLLQAYWRGGYRLLLWSGLCFAGLDQQRASGRRQDRAADGGPVDVALGRGARREVLAADAFFLLFAVAFALDAATRLMLGMSELSDEQEPLFYLARLVTFGLILLAIADKNRGGGGS
jgi:hypothetical protein